MSADELQRIPPHRLIVEPLVAVAEEICVFQTAQYEIEVPMPPHAPPKRGRYQLDQTQELVRGYERFWNAGAWRRGAVTLRMRNEAIDWKALFHWVEYGGVWSSRHQIKKGTPSSAVTYCDKHAVGPVVVFSLSASNGIQRMDVWSDIESCHQLDALAQSTCRHFVRDVETGKFPRELVYNLPEYRDLI